MASLGRTETGWQVRWKTPERSTRKRNFTRKPDALRFKASRIEHDLHKLAPTSTPQPAGAHSPTTPGPGSRQSA